MQPCGVRLAGVLLGASISSAVFACDAPGASEPVRLFMEDGQLISRPVWLFVNRNIPATANPTLKLYGGHAVTKLMAGDDRATPVQEWFPDQSWTTTVDGTKVTLCGTWITVHLPQTDFIEWYKPMRSFTPTLSWDGGAAALSHRVNIGYAPAAWAWAGGVVLLLSLIIFAMAYPVRWVFPAAWRRLPPSAPAASHEANPEASHESPFGLLCADDRHLSLSKAQVALWTTAIGAVVFFHGLIQLDVPIIPTQLLVLMGLSVATGGISYLAPPPQAVASTTDQPNPAGGAKIRPALSDLIRTFPNPGTPELSISRAQMLFWTVVTVILFVSKSALEGGPWEVPWTLVGLMGISQAAYLFPKYYGTPNA